MCLRTVSVEVRPLQYTVTVIGSQVGSSTAATPVDGYWHLAKPARDFIVRPNFTFRV